MFKVLFLTLFFIFTNPVSAKEVLLVTEAWAPYAYSENGKSTGMDVEIVKEVFKTMKQRVKIEFHPWKKVIELIQSGKADGALLSPYKKRYLNFAFFPSSQNFDANYIFFSNVQTLTKGLVTKFEDVLTRNLKIGVVKGFTYTKKFWDIWGSNKQSIVEFSNIDELFKGLNNDKVQLAPMLKEVGAHHIAIHKLSNIKKVGANFGGKPYITIFSKQSKFSSKKVPNVELLAKAYESSLFALKKTKKYQEILKKY